VFAPGELEALSTQYKRTAGFDPVALNERPSWSIDTSTTAPDQRSGGQSQ
jgi:hypothetical protein